LVVIEDPLTCPKYNNITITSVVQDTVMTYACC